MQLNSRKVKTMPFKTKFRIFLQPPYVPGFEQPVTVEIETDDKIEAGPADAFLYVLDAENKPSYRAGAPHEYQPYRGRPWKGDMNRFVARPNYAGDFDHLAPDDPAFPAAAVYATARLVLNFWNRIFRETGLDEVKAWHHRPEDLEKEREKFADRLQLVPRCMSAGSRSGYGYVEVGRDNPGHRYREGGTEHLTYQKGNMWQNFDVIAHEMGHAILFKYIGFPQAADGVREWFDINEREFLAFHESMADLCAILSLLDIKEARDFFLTRKSGVDVVAGIGELQRLDDSGFLPIRSARNNAVYQGLDQFKNNQAHQHSMSLTGAIFDSLLVVYEQLRDRPKNRMSAESALAQARDIVAKSLAKLWARRSYRTDSPVGISFPEVSKVLVELLSSELEDQDKGEPIYNKIAQQFEKHGLFRMEERKEAPRVGLTAQVVPVADPPPATPA
jgi:hypothetical protein